MKWFLSGLAIVFSVFLVSYGVSCYYAYFYPLQHKESIVFYAEKYDVEPELIASIINVESGFKANAKSNKGAIGLMQVLPSTAEWVSQQLGIDYAKIDLFDVNTNLQIGSYYFSYLLHYYEDQKLAICAYNAGLGNVNRWRGLSLITEENGEIKNIPFKETENYLNSVLKNLKYYKNKFI